MFESLQTPPDSKTLLFAIYQVMTQLLTAPRVSSADRPWTSVALPESPKGVRMAASLLQEIRLTTGTEHGELSNRQLQTVFAELFETLKRNATTRAPGVGAALLESLRAIQVLRRELDVFMHSPKFAGSQRARIEQVEREMIKRLLESAEFSTPRAAQMLGLHRNTLARKMRQLEVKERPKRA